MTFRSDMTQKEYDHNRYMAKRDAIRERRRDYYWNYFKKGLKKPRQRTPRSIRDHERYLENRDEILAQQKVYRDTHKQEIKDRRRKRNYEKYITNYERRERQQSTAGLAVT